MSARVTAALMSFVVIVTLVGCGGGNGASAGAGPADAASIVQARCTVCHGIERINAAHHDRAAWESTISRMRGKGARLTDAEATAVVEYLTAREAPSTGTPVSAGP